MLVKELKEELNDYEDNMEVFYSINGKDVYDVEVIGRCELENGQTCVVLI